jgi:hypothetical protein
VDDHRRDVTLVGSAGRRRSGGPRCGGRLARHPRAPNKICADFSGFVDKAVHETVPPSVSTVTGLGRLPAVSCTWGPVSITDMRATIQDYLLNAPKSGTLMMGKCTKAVTFTGTNTVATTNAATNRRR